MRRITVVGNRASLFLQRHPGEYRMMDRRTHEARRSSEYVFVGSESRRLEEPNAGHCRPLAATLWRPPHSAGQAEGRVRSHYSHTAQIHLRAHVYSPLPDDIVMPCSAIVHGSWRHAGVSLADTSSDTSRALRPHSSPLTFSRSRVLVAAGAL